MVGVSASGPRERRLRLLSCCGVGVDPYHPGHPLFPQPASLDLDALDELSENVARLADDGLDDVGGVWQVADQTHALAGHRSG